ncbi:hypothetical protein MASR2M78_19510 [Treponema sp.]
MAEKSIIQNAFEQEKGILRLVPNWVPRSFCIPGRRIKLHPDDYYSLGGDRGGIDERWFSSTTPADNGPKTGKDEGMSFIVFNDGKREHRFLLKDAVDELKGALIGERLWKEFGRWPMFSKFFDNQGALPHHIHHRDQHAKKVGMAGKPETYYFPPQMNNHGGDFPYTFFGLQGHVTKDQVLACLKDFTSGDNKITNISQAYRLEVGTGWDVPPGILHAPGSLCTYEPQFASDVFAMYQSLVNNQIVEEPLLWKNMPEDKVGDFNYLLEVIDWEANIDRDFAEKRFMRPKPAHDEKEMKAAGYQENWIIYKSPWISAKELTIQPGTRVTIKDAAAYGMIVLQGHGTMAGREIESPALIRFGQLTNDEFFVSEEAAKKGLEFYNPSSCDPIVILKHFAAKNPDLKL